MKWPLWNYLIIVRSSKVVVCILVVSTKMVQEEQWKASSFDPRRHGNGHLPPTQHGRSLAHDLSHNWQVTDCDDCDAAAAAQRSAVTDEQLRANNLYHLSPTRKIPHTTGKLRKRAPSRKKRYPICSETTRVYPILSISQTKMLHLQKHSNAFLISANTPMTIKPQTLFSVFHRSLWIQLLQPW